MRTKLLLCSISLMISLISSAQYTPDMSISNAIPSAYGFDYTPTDPMIKDYLASNSEPVALQGYPTVAFDTTRTRWSQTDTGKSLIVSASLITVGLFTYKDSGFMNRVSIKEGINRYLPDFENRLDDYVQYAPYVAVYALDGLGVKSKHKLLRKTTTLATGALTTLAVVQGMKYGIGELRPDGSANNAFPSGHTATAFLGAHLLHKEYGDRSIYYSVGGYAFATVVGIFRQLNDRHWISDVLVGAGIGISAAELAYFINDKIYKDKGINDIEIRERQPNNQKPSFLGVKIGYSDLTQGFNDPDAGITANSGFSLAVEGAWFFSKYVGIGAEIGFQSFPIDVSNIFEQAVGADGFDLLFQPVGSNRTLVGPYLQYTKNKNMFGAKFLMGTSRIADTEILLQPQVGDDPTEIDDILFAEIRPDTQFAWSTGVYFRRLIDKRLALGVYVDYTATTLDTSVSFIDNLSAGPPYTYSEDPIKDGFNSISAGINLNVMIW